MMSTLKLLSDLNETTHLCQKDPAFIDGSANSTCTLPVLNADVSGPGVRISFYLQALFLSTLAARSDKIEEINSALYTLMLTNVAMAVTTLVLGFDPCPEISFQDALVVIYLLALSWCAVMSTLPMYNRHIKIKASLQLFAVIQTLVVLACSLAVLIKAQTFGSSPLCNSMAKLVIFGKIRALNTGRIVASTIVAIVAVAYAWLTYQDYKALVRKCARTLRRKMECFAVSAALKVKGREPGTDTVLPSFIASQAAEGDRELDAIGSSPSNLQRIGEVSAVVDSPRQSNPSGTVVDSERSSSSPPTQTADNTIQRDPALGSLHGHGHRHGQNRHPHWHDRRSSFDLNIDGQLIVQLFVVAVLWSLFVLNTELLIKANFLNHSEGTVWAFGQVLPMFLVLLPFVSLVRAFRKHGLKKSMHKKHVHEGRKKKRTKDKKKASRERERNISQVTRRK